MLRRVFSFVAVALLAVPLLVNAPLLDPDEGLHAAIAQEMVLRYDYVTPTFLGEPFLDKPILFFWAEAFSLRLFGMNEAAVRIPPLVFGTLGMLSVALLAGAMFGATAGLVAGIVYATMVLPVAISNVAVHDIALVPFMCAAAWCFWRAAHDARAWRWGIPAGVCLGLSILTKGLAGAVFAGIFVVCLAAVRPSTTARLAAALVVAGVLALLVAAPWYIAMERAHAGYLYYYFVERHLRGYLTATQRHAGRPFWYYVPIVLGGALPWTGYIGGALRGLWSGELSVDARGGSSVPRPESRVPRPESRVPRPESPVPRPESRVPSPESQVPRPESRVPSAESRVPRPESQVPPPASRVPGPESEVPRPESQVPRPESRVPIPESRVPRPASRVPSPKSRVPSPASRVPRPASRVPRPESRGRASLAIVWAWFAIGFLFLSVGESKLVTYVLPIFPALAIALGASLAAARRSRLGFITAVASLAVLPAAAVAAVHVLLHAPVGAMWIVPAAAGAAVLAIAFYAAHRPSIDTVVAAPPAMAIVSLAAVLVSPYPRAADYLTSRDLARVLNESAALPSRVSILDERIGSIVFYLSPALRAAATPERIQPASFSEAIERARRDPDDAVIAVRDDQLQRFARLFPQPPQPSARAGTFTVFRVDRLRDALDAPPR